MLVRQVDGRTHRMRLQPDGLKTASMWVDHYRRFWDTQLDRLSAFLQVASERTEVAHSTMEASRPARPGTEESDE